MLQYTQPRVRAGRCSTVVRTVGLPVVVGLRHHRSSRLEASGFGGRRRVGPSVPMTEIWRRWQNAIAIVRFTWTHPANRGRRLRQLARSAAFEIDGRFLRRKRRLIHVGRSRMWADHAFDSSVFSFHGWPVRWNDMQVWRRHLHQGDLFVDVGANIGAYTLWAAEGEAEVIALEPNGPACGRLREHVELNEYGNRVTVICAAAGAASGTARMTDSLGAANHLILNDGGGDVRVEAIDDIVGTRRVAGMKVDVEGAERLVLQGAERALKERRIALLQLEWNALSWDLLGEDRTPVANLLREYGYGLFYPDESGSLHPVSEPASHPGARDVFAAPLA
jgi:FkbM family methyltransferase